MQPVWLDDYKLRMIAHDQKTFSIVAGVIFTLVALFHLGADLYGLASRHRGLVDRIGLVVAGGLAFFGFRLAALAAHEPRWYDEWSDGE